MYIELSDYDPALIAMGMLMIFPSLTEFVTRSPAWGRLEVLVMGLKQVGGLTALTKNFMACLNEVRESVENGVPVRSAVSSRLSFRSFTKCEWVFLCIDATLCPFSQEDIARIFCGPLSGT